MVLKDALKVTFLSLLSGGITYIYLRKKQLEKIIDSLKIEVAKINNINLSFNRIKASVYLQIINPTPEDLELNTTIIYLGDLRVLDKKTKKVLATTKLNTNSLLLPAKSVYNVPKINVQIPLEVGFKIALKKLANNKEDIIKQFSFELDLHYKNYTKTLEF